MNSIKIRQRFWMLITLFLIGQTFIQMFPYLGISQYVYRTISNSDGIWHRVSSKLTGKRNRDIFENGYTSNDQNMLTMHQFLPRVKQRTSLGVFTQNITMLFEQTFSYDNFEVTAPRFITNRSKELFYKYKDNLPLLGQQTDAKQLTGKLYVIKNGAFDKWKDCGYRSDINWITSGNKTNDNRTQWFDMAAPLFVPDGNTFQHMIDGVLPKLIQSLHFLQHQNVKILMKRPRDKIVYEMFNRLNISTDRLVFDSGNPIHAKKLVFICIAPPVHSQLWHAARKLLGASEQLAVPVKEARVVIITRKGCFNCGRLVLNEDELAYKLSLRYGSDKVALFEGPLTLDESIKLFKNAKIVMGAHVGGMQNILFAPINTTIIEFTATYDDGTMIAPCHSIIWRQAQLLGQDCWKMAIKPENKNGDINVNITELELLLDVVDKRYKQRLDVVDKI